MTHAGLFDPLYGSDRVDAELTDAAWVRALLDVEVAASRAAAKHGVVGAAAAERVAAAAETLEVDPGKLGRAAVEGGNPVIPLVRMLRAAAAGPDGESDGAGSDGSAGGAGSDAPGGVGSGGADSDGSAVDAAVHPGLTSQDVMDTALVLLVRRAAPVLLDDLHAAANAAARLAEAHRDTPMMARTLGQQALPTTFGLVAAGWCAGLDRAGKVLDRAVAALPVQLGGAAGTLGALHPCGLAVADTLAELLGLAPQQIPWHTERTRIGELAGALAVAAGACAKPATDVVLLAGTELGEVSEAAPGDSSSMPHKRNPIAAITARASARRAPGLAATLLASMDHEHQRAAGAWHAEWVTLTDLLKATGGAAARLRVCLEGLRVHPEAMAAKVHGDVEHHAGDLVDRVLVAR